MKTLYFDCFAGASGNMILGGLISLGIEPQKLIESIEKLNIPKFNIEFVIADRAGISSIHASTMFPDEKQNRHLPEIEKIINNSDLPSNVKKRSLSIFRNLAEAEAKVHGIAVEKVHFHEVGAMDAIIDVVGACIGFEILGIEKFACSKIHVGSGFVNMSHGKFPVPPPAVAELLRNIPIYSTEIEGELMTPTGAAIISTVCDRFGKIPKMTIEKTAYGAGTRQYPGFPNVLRLFLGTTSDTEPDAGLLLIETNIDDLSPQVLGFVMDRAFELGCLDCWFTPIQMKKNRPGTLVSILCENDQREVFANLLYTETTTLGLRVREVERDCLPREIVTVKTEFGEVEVKIAKFNGRVVNAKPEYEQVREIALRSRLALHEVEKIVLDKLRN